MNNRFGFAAVLLCSCLAMLSACYAQGIPAESFSETTNFVVSAGEPQTVSSKDNGLYSDGTRAINEGRWSAAVAIFTKVASERGGHVDGALYWKAYAENKQGQSDRALSTCEELRRDHPKSPWIEECGALEIEIRAKSGQPIQPQAEHDEDLKLLALNSVMKQDELRALPEIQKILDGDLPETFKERALFILAQGQTKQAQELLDQIAQGHSNVPLRAKAAEMIAHGRDNRNGSVSLTTGDKHKPNIQSFVRGEVAAMPANSDEKLSGAASGGGTANRAITLDVVVTDKSGKPVTGLRAQDFMVLDNKQPGNIASFHEVNGVSSKAESPVEVFLVVDGINLAFSSHANTRHQLVKYLGQNGGRLALPTSFIVLTDTNVQIPLPPTRDGNALASYLDSSANGLRVFGAGGVFEAEERWQLSLRALDVLMASMSKTRGRKIIVWISPGWPELSGFEWLRTQHDQDELFDYIVGVSTTLRKARMTLCSVDPEGAYLGRFSDRNFFYRTFLKGVTTVKQADYGDLFLKVLATQTGGQVLFGSNDIEGMIGQCAADANAYYVLSFDSPPAIHPNEYHGIEVQVGKPKLKARTRTGYYAQP